MSIRSSLHSALTHFVTQYTVAVALFIVSGMLLFGHAVRITEAQNIVVPLVAELPKLERTRAVLQEQAELAELESSVRSGSQMERVRTYILPETSDIDRTVAFFDVLRDSLQEQGTLGSMSDIVFGDVQVTDGQKVQPFTVRFAVHKDAVHDISTLIQLSGLLTVGDALTKEEIALLLQTTEAENPSGIVSLEQFLSTDLLTYAQNTKLAEERLLRSFTSTAFVQTLQSVTRTSLLRDAARVMDSSLGAAIHSYNLWPLQMMNIRYVEMVPGNAKDWYTLTLDLQLQLR